MNVGRSGLVGSNKYFHQVPVVASLHRTQQQMGRAIIWRIGGGRQSRLFVVDGSFQQGDVLLLRDPYLDRRVRIATELLDWVIWQFGAIPNHDGLSVQAIGDILN